MAYCKPLKSFKLQVLVPKYKGDRMVSESWQDLKSGGEIVCAHSEEYLRDFVIGSYYIDLIDLNQARIVEG